MLHFFGGLAMIALGALVIVKSEWVYSNFGPIAWFEEHLGAEGGSRLGWKLIGLIVVFFGTLVMTNLVGGFLMWVLSPLLKYTQR